MEAKGSRGCEGYSGQDLHGHGSGRWVGQSGAFREPGGKRCQSHAGQDRVAKALAGGPGRVVREGSVEAKCGCVVVGCEQPRSRLVNVGQWYPSLIHTADVLTL